MELTLLITLLAFRFSFGQENPTLPFLPFKHLHTNTAIDGPQPWFDGEVPSKDHCFHKCIKQDFTNCEYVQYKEVSATTWLCKLYGIISDLSSYLISTEGEMLAQAVHQNIDCQDWYDKGYKQSGVFFIYYERYKMKVWCKMYGAPYFVGMIEIQKRKDGSVNFNRTWNEYKVGFGDPATEYWLGNDNIHKLTYGRNMLLRIGADPFIGNSIYTIFENFFIENEANNYTIHTGTPHPNFDSYAVNGDWIFHDQKPFSTIDRDLNGFNCPFTYKCGWWFNYCFKMNFNGVYKFNEATTNRQGIIWTAFIGNEKSLKKSSLSITRMT
ncbi:microfibril-associated glycoprotein 4-like [Clytia hemisphaerica]